MEQVIFRSDDTSVLDGFVSRFRIGIPYLDENDVRIGTVLAIRREGNAIVADIECVPDDQPLADEDFPP